MIRRSKFRILFAAILAVVSLAPLRACMAQDGGQYEVVKDWAKIPNGAAWGTMAAVATDAKGNVYAYQRADTAKVMIFDRKGNFVREWGTDQFEFPHGLFVGPDGSVWASDKKREQFMKFTPEGKLLMTIGEKDVAGNATSETAFNGTANVAIGKNGDIFVADGENSAPAVAPYNNRVVKFTKDGKFVKMWGTKGTGQGELQAPHCIAVDSKDRVWVGDRNNQRIQIFDADGKYLTEYKQFGRPASIYIAKDDTVYVGAQDTVVIGKTDGTILTTIENVPDAHGIAVDEATGAIYVAQVNPKAVLKFVKKK